MNSPDEYVRNIMIQEGKKAVEKASYFAGNKTENLNFLIKAATVRESSRAAGSTVFKASRDMIRGDNFGLCLVFTACEGLAVVYSTCKFVPYRKTVWLSYKVASQSLVRYRNLCAGEGC